MKCHERTMKNFSEIMQTYKRAPPDAKRKFDKESKQSAKHLRIDNMEC